ncbi:MAG: prolyl oligopeptidase family serine peptidase [Bacteroidia bacterium]
MFKSIGLFSLICILPLFHPAGKLADNPSPKWDFDGQLSAYFEAQTRKLELNTQSELSHITDWPAFQKQSREQLLEMLGLSPMPEHTPLNPVITGTIDHGDFIVEKLYFQSSPGLYVTGNLYRPKNLTEKAPAILYVCGHGQVIKDGIAYGSKVHYQHHPAWFARHGYVCLIIDTMQLGEIEGIHRGTHHLERWWWISRGYTPAGVEAWNGIRAVDYLVSRPEVDAEKIGITGRSGGGIYSWWAAGIDERIKVAIPVAGVTDLRNYVVDGCVTGHCDCMFMVNTYQWDYPKVATLFAPKPLLISNSDRDPIFPINGVFRTYQTVRGVYEKMEKGDLLALNTVAGPHMDIQELQIHAFRWMNHYLKEKDELIEDAAVKYFEPEQLKVFDKLPEDQINTQIDETFVPVAEEVEKVLKNTSWKEAAKQWEKNLKEKVFAGWPEEMISPALTPVSEQKNSFAEISLHNLQTDANTHLPLFSIKPLTENGKPVQIIPLDNNNWLWWKERLGASFAGGEFWPEATGNETLAAELQQRLSTAGEIILVPMRGTGPAAFSANEKDFAQIRRRYYLLGQTLESMQTLDLIQAMNAVMKFRYSDTEIHAEGVAGVQMIYASLFAKHQFPYLSIHIYQPPASHREGPCYLNVMKYMDIPAAILMASQQQEVVIHSPEKKIWKPLEKLAGKEQLLKLHVED